MASLFTHAVAAGAVGQAAPSRYRGDWRFWYMALLVSALPDADVLGFRFGVRYEDLWGHRGMTHSLPFAAVLGVAAAARFRPDWKTDGRRLALVLVLIAASHGFLDAFTDGGLGVAFFAPFDAGRYFFPWRPIAVSPIGARNFFNARGLAVILSEVRAVWVPSLAVGWGLRRWSN
ncbi:MAG: metal-dependent hydrolase [Elusimicrobia bacterium]|nr:metal-dependent hydrolase [Elusimicrobiota bacterium]